MIYHRLRAYLHVLFTPFGSSTINTLGCPSQTFLLFCTSVYTFGCWSKVALKENKVFRYDIVFIPDFWPIQFLSCVTESQNVSFCLKEIFAD